MLPESKTTVQYLNRDNSPIVQQVACWFCMAKAGDRCIFFRGLAWVSTRNKPQKTQYIHRDRVLAWQKMQVDNVPEA